MIRVIRCGYESRHTVPFVMNHDKGLSNYLLLLIKSPAFCEVQGQGYELTGDNAILFERDRVFRYGGSTESFNDDWVHFEEEGSDLIQELKLPVNSPFSVSGMNRLTDLVRMLTRCKQDDGPASDPVLDALMHALLYSLKEQFAQERKEREESRYYHSLSQLRAEMRNAPHKKWEVAQAAQTLHMSISYFEHLYRECFGLPFRQDIIRARLELSCFYLGSTDMEVRAVAEMCGYENELHYMRQFRKFTGQTPSQYRNLTEKGRGSNSSDKTAHLLRSP